MSRRGPWLLLVGGLAATGCHGPRATTTPAPPAPVVAPGAASEPEGRRLISEPRARAIADLAAATKYPKFVVRADYEQCARLEGEIWVISYLVVEKDPAYITLGGDLEVRLDAHTGSIVAIELGQ